MCGISIIYRRERAPIERARVVAMNRALTHRGPDADSVLLHPGVAFGHTRLSIVDIAGGTQPMQTSDARCAIVFNGEIYNYSALRGALRADGTALRTESDTEVVLELYRRHRVKALAQLRGMFAFAIHDLDSGELFLARDRLGIKPLFYYWDGTTFVAASEIKALFASGLVAPVLAPASIANYFTYQFSVAPHTPFRDVYELPPGHTLTIDEQGRFKIARYWDLTFPREDEYESHDESYWLPRFADALHDATAAHTIGDVPIGAYLSGGIDSCTTASLLKDRYPQPLQTFSIGFGNAAYDESQEFSAAAAHIGVANRVLTLDDARPEGYLDTLVGALNHLEQPQRMAVDVPHFMLSEFVRANGYKVVYTGDGADEILAGYDCFRQDLMRVWSNGFFKRALRRRRYLKQYTQYFAEDQMRMLLGLHSARCQRRTIKRFGFYPGWHDFWNITADARAAILSPDIFAAGEAQLDTLTHELQAGLAGRHPLNQSLYFETKTRLPGWILWKSDRLSMAHGVEARTPFMDHPLVELAARIPPQLKLNGLNEKYLLKRMMQPHLPERADAYKKRGFYTPISAWFFTPQRYTELEPYLSPDALRRCGLFAPNVVDALYRRLNALGTPTNLNDNYRVMQIEWVLFTVLSTQILHRLFVEKQAACFTLDRDNSAAHKPAVAGPKDLR